MTPYELNIVLHYYSRCEDWDGPSKGNELHRRTMDMLILNGVIEPNDGSQACWRGMKYTITERGIAFVEHLKETPLPKKVWARGDSKAKETE